MMTSRLNAYIKSPNKTDSKIGKAARIFPKKTNDVLHQVDVADYNRFKTSWLPWNQ